MIERAPIKILVSGSTGLVGRALGTVLESGGHSVTRLARADSVQAPRILWDPMAGQIDERLLEGFDAVVHLAGENIAGARWTPAVKERIRQSRVRGTTLLAEALARLQRPPKTLVCASAIGYYGDRGEEVLTEDSVAGSGFLPEVCQAWEAACAPASAKGIRVVQLRFGVVLSRQGGALAKMIFPFQLGVGGNMGKGNQWWSWVSLKDVVGAIQHALKTESLNGPVNVTAPAPARNREFTKALGQALHRPTLFPMPGFAARLVLGEMAPALLLASARVEPNKLLASGYVFQHPTLETALPLLLRRHGGL